MDVNLEGVGRNDSLILQKAFAWAALHFPTTYQISIQLNSPEISPLENKVVLFNKKEDTLQTYKFVKSTDQAYEEDLINGIAKHFPGKLPRSA